MLITIPAIAAETFLESFFSSFGLSPFLFLLVYFFLGVALVEEFLKYLVVRLGVFSNSALDEPVDLVMYMIIAGLGFAAFENILLLFRLAEIFPPSDIFLVNSIRFVQAVFLHALASGLLGYFVALSFFRKNLRLPLLLGGLACATALHGAFNFYIFTIGDKGLVYLLAPVVPLLALAVFISFAFKQLNRYKAACAA